MSEVKVNKISPRSGTDVTLGDSGDTFTIPSGATINNQGTAVNFGATGSASWVTTVKTSTFTAVAGEGYFVNTTGGAVTVNLPAGTAGAVVAVKDYANTFDSNICTLVQNGSDKIGGSAVNVTLSTEGIAVTLVFIDSTQGWLVTDSGLQSEAPTAAYITATGGTILTSSCGNFKSHVFTGPGTFTVCTTGNAAGSNTVDYLVVAGGASAGGYYGAGGAGGFRVSNGYCTPNMSPLSATASLPVSATGYPISIGAGGTAGPPGGGGIGAYDGNNGVNTVFTGSSTITAAGGGKGVSSGPTVVGGSGGSGGSSGYYRPAVGQGAGNTPPVSPPQGNPGGRASYANAGGGGGAGAAGSDGTIGGSWTVTPTPGTNQGGPGGIGSYISDATLGPTAPSYGTPGPVSSTRYFAGGGGGGVCAPGSVPGVGGSGGGGNGQDNGGPFSAAQDGTVNTGGGGGASGGGLGGSGIVIIRYKFQN